MSRLITRSIRIFDSIINSFAMLAAILVLLLVAVTLYEIIMRYFIGRSELWTLETTEFSLLYITFLATAWLLKEERHVTMDLVLSRFKLRNQAKISAVTSVIGAVMFLMLTWYGAKVTWQSFQTGYLLPTMMEAPAFAILLIIPVGSFLLFIQFLRRAYRHLMSWKAKDET